MCGGACAYVSLNEMRDEENDQKSLGKMKSNLQMIQEKESARGVVRVMNDVCVLGVGQCDEQIA